MSGWFVKDATNQKRYRDTSNGSTGRAAYFLPLAEYLKGESFNNAEPLREADRAVDWLLTKLDRIS